MPMRNFFIGALIIFIGYSGIAYAELEPILESRAFAKYKKRIKSDLSQLIYLLDRFNTPEIEMKIDGNTYRAEFAFPFAKTFLAIYYKKEKAETWIQKYCYRSPFTNQVMLGCMTGQECIPGRDLLLNELQELRKAEQILNALPPEQR